MIPQSNPREWVIEEFKNLFHTDPSFLVRAPGRVNLIGEHTDYNARFCSADGTQSVDLDRSFLPAKSGS